MASARWRLAFAGAVLLAALVGHAADAPPGTEAKMPREPDRPTAADEPKGAPTVILTQKEYQELLRLARAEGAIRPEPPSSCKVTGRVAGDLARLRVEFEFRTGQRRTRVALGCAQGFPTEAKIDGHPPVLRWGGTDGLSVLVEEAGDHQLVLEMDLLLAAREKGAERGLDLDLPAAATTTLELELPAGVKRALVRPMLREAGSSKPSAVQEFRTDAAGPPRFKTPGLGPVERLEVTWEGQAPAAGPPLLNVSRSRIVVQVDGSTVSTDAEISLEVRRGQIKDAVQLFVPAQAVVRGIEGDDRVTPSDKPDPKGGARTVLVKPTADPLTLTIHLRQPHSDGPIPIGPFLIQGAFPQAGEILVRAPAELSLDYEAKGESHYRLIRREPTDEERRQFANVRLALHYSTLPGADKDAPPFLGLLARRHQGVLEAKVTHTLRLVPGVGAQPSAWRVVTTIEPRAHNNEPDQLLLQLPPLDEYAFDRNFGVQPAGEVEVGASDDVRHTLALKPTGSKWPPKLTFEGQYTAGAANAGQLAVTLPGLLNRKAGSAVVAVVLPPDQELVPPRAGPLWDAGVSEGPGKRTWTFDRWPDRFEVAWQPYRPPLVLNGEARLTILGRQGSVSHRLWLPPGQAAPDQLPLRVPNEVIGLAVAGEGGTRLERKPGGPPAVQLAPPTDRDHPVILTYSFRLPERAADSFPVPLVVVPTATGGESRVYVWSDPGTRPELKDGRWEVRRTEEVKGVDSFPSLVLMAPQPSPPLTLGLGEGDGVSLAAFRVERVLIQAAVEDGGQQRYRARFVVGQIATPSLDVDLPAPLFRPNPADVAVLLAGKPAVWKPVDEAGREAAVSRTARVQVPADLAGKSIVLEIAYTLLPGRTVLQTMLQPPQLRGDPGAAPVRWQVVLPSSWVPLSQDALGPDYGWQKRGWLMALRPTVTTGDFERWFAGSEGPRADDSKPYPDPTVAVWRSVPEPLRLSHVPEQPWLLVCSLTLLIVGLALAFVSLPRAVFWGTLAATGVGLLLAGLFWPGVLAAILYGCEPGALVLLPVLAVQWLLQQRYRRQVVFLPGFTRMKAGSSLVRGSSNRPRGEPATVDATPSVASGPRPASTDSGSKKPPTDGSAKPG